MAIAAQTKAVQVELLRQLEIAAKDLRVKMTQPQDLTYTGAAFDTIVTALKAALTAAGY